MKTIVDLGDYDSVVESQFKLAVALALPVEDSNYMPVTRDLSPAKRATLLKWLGPLGSTVPPAKGDAPDPASNPPPDLRRMKSGR